MSASPYVTDPAELLTRRSAADQNTIASRKRRLAATLADLGMPTAALQVLGSDALDSLRGIREILARRRDACNSMLSNADVAAYRTALDECGALWCVL